MKDYRTRLSHEHQDNFERMLRKYAYHFIKMPFNMCYETITKCMSIHIKIKRTGERSKKEEKNTITRLY